MVLQMENEEKRNSNAVRSPKCIFYGGRGTAAVRACSLADSDTHTSFVCASTCFLAPVCASLCRRSPITIVHLSSFALSTS